MKNCGHVKHIVHCNLHNITVYSYPPYTHALCVKTKNMAIAFVCKATLLKSLKKGNTPVQCSHMAKEGTDYCGRHRKFAINQSASTPQPPPPPPTNTNYTDCVICFNRLDCHISTTTCGHHYHKSCIEKWLQRSNTCPCCRFEISPKKLNNTNLRDMALSLRLSTIKERLENTVVGSDEYIDYSLMLAIRKYEDVMNAIY